jgi:predicted RNA binding protein YcfA (HicA-like mRNA interferase family)
MNTFKLSNISLDDMLRFLNDQGLKHIGTEGGHLKYSRADLNRPIVLQSHISPVPEFIVKQILVHLSMKRKDLQNYFHPKKDR